MSGMQNPWRETGKEEKLGGIINYNRSSRESSYSGRCFIKILLSWMNSWKSTVVFFPQRNGEEKE